MHAIMRLRSAIKRQGVWYNKKHQWGIIMVIVTFPDKHTQKKALGSLLGRFSGKVLKSGEHVLPEAALEALAGRNIEFTVKGKASYEQQVAAIRGAAADPVQ